MYFDAEILDFGGSHEISVNVQESADGTSNWTSTGVKSFHHTAANKNYQIDFTPTQNYIRILVRNGSTPTGVSEAYFDNFRISEGSTEEIVGQGVGNKLAFKYRIHDAAIGRFLSRDPLSKGYPWFSPYSFSGNRVIDMIELEGAEPTKPHLYWNTEPELQKEWFGDIKNAVLYSTQGMHGGDQSRPSKMYVLMQYNTVGEVNYHYKDEITNKWIIFDPNDLADPEDVERIALTSIYATGMVIGGAMNPALSKELLSQFFVQAGGTFAIESINYLLTGEGSIDIDAIILESINSVDIFDGGVSVTISGKSKFAKILVNAVQAGVDFTLEDGFKIKDDGTDFVIDLGASFAVDAVSKLDLPKGKYHKLLNKVKDKITESVTSQAAGETKEQVNELD